MGGPELLRPVTERADGADLVRNHFDFIWRLVRRLGLSRVDADDVTQQVFMIATQKLSNIRSGDERTFLYGVALRTLANFKRKAHHRREEVGLEVPEFRDAAAQPDEAFELARALQLLDRLLAELTPELRRAFVLASIEQLEIAEIAVLEGIPQGTVGGRVAGAGAAVHLRGWRAGARPRGTSAAASASATMP